MEKYCAVLLVILTVQSRNDTNEGESHIYMYLTHLLGLKIVWGVGVAVRLTPEFLDKFKTPLTELKRQ